MITTLNMLNVTVTGRGPSLIWAHGLMHSMAQETATGWFHPAQPDRIRRVRYDARGHGRSPGSTTPDDYTWPAQANDLLAVAAAHSTGPCALGGHSMGSASALLAALRAPEKVSCLVLATPPTAWQTRPAQIRRYRQMQRIIRQKGFDRLLALAEQNPALPDWLLHSHPEHAQASLQALRQMHSDALMAILDAACGADLPPPASLQQLTVPTLILAWENDPIHPLQTALTLAQSLPNAELRIINSARQLADWPAQIDAFVAAHSAV